MGVLTHESKDAISDSVPFQNHRLPNAIPIHGPQDPPLIRIVRCGPVVGVQQNRKRTAAVRGRLQHGSQARPRVVKLVVAQSGGVISQSAHSPQLCGLGGIERLD